MNKTHCVVEACKRLRQRALKLNVPNDKPVAVFQEIKKGKKKCMFY